ncbi:bifunctional phosphopantothenoylcysteine decarboxylase/phosphopantothenate--cysteine ligase CoaBC [Sulfurivirga sp.]|uniref:bifunctional phosphopantothenoylcysteine decarboxylase/phosphopantothenate--cysteine ligase CoaBC n=1 Tax=Sulfurivirga sp. TaxID=2614236 RepID=UPI0025EB4CD8|nr:bifunctional phosphopantothenoylcysteine decarboxylase/phosphopantothenate--cysteine ligase CoaBC [Sulfurivirga sp.]
MRVILGITGGIAAYKSILLLRLLRQAGHEVQVVLTRAARQFVTPLTLQALSGRPVRDSLFDPEQEDAMGHIELARWAEAVVVAPASADFIARLRAGMADDLLATLCLATEAPIVLAPAMNRLMWVNPATQENIDVLRARGVRILPPESGEQACGEVGEGRMMEPEGIFSALWGENGLFPGKNQGAAGAGEPAACKNGGDPVFWRGKRVVVTAGPTEEPIDPVRFIANRSSGRMGFALAEALRNAGAEVTLVAGPVSLPTPAGVHRIDVRTAEEMDAAVQQAVAGADVFISAAAVADWRVAHPSDQKLKKQQGQDSMTLELVRNPDILARVAARPDRPGLVIGFAAETERVVEHAREKLAAKGADMLIANEVGEDRAFGQPDNAVWLLHRNGRERHFERQPKDILAKQLIETIAQWSEHDTDG